MRIAHSSRSVAWVFTAASLALLASACPPAGQSKDAGETACEVPRDCGAGFDCIDSVCVKLGCTEDSECNVAVGEHCDTLRQICVGCRPGLAGACPAGKVCLGGQCSEPPPPADSCELSPSQAVVRAGETVSLGATGLMNSGALAPLAQFTWSVGDSTCLSVVDGVVTGSASATSTCTSTVIAQPVGGTATCEATVSNFPAVTLPQLRALVIDEYTGTGVSGVKVLVRTDDGSGGSIQTLATVNTDAQGVGLVSDIGISDATRILDVSVFHNNYGYVTVVRPRSNDVIFHVRKLPSQEVMAGVKGRFDFSNVHTDGDIKLGLAGFSILGSLSDLDVMALLGENVERDINLEGVGNFEDVPLPSGLYMEVGSAAVKNDFQAFGEAGKRILWGLGGRVRLAEVGPIISQVAGEGGDLDIGGILAAVLPHFGSFDHAIISNLDLVEVPRPNDDSEPNTWTFNPAAEQILAVKTQLTQEADYAIPRLPSNPWGEGYASGTVIIVCAMVPGQGIVPLGLSAGLDAPNENDVADGLVSPTPCPESRPACAQADPGHVLTYFAPPHSGLEGTRYITTSMALGLDSIGTAGYTSVLVSISDSIENSGGNSFPAGSYLDFVKSGTYTRNMFFQQDAAISGADFYRLNMDNDGRSWQVYFDEADALAGVNLPDPMVDAGMSERRADEADIQAFGVFTGSMDVHELFTFNGTNLGDLLELTASYSTMECVEVEQPQNGNCDDGYTVDSATGLCVGGPNAITAFVAAAANCGNGYQAVYQGGVDTNPGICAKTPPCLWQD